MAKAYPYRITVAGHRIKPDYFSKTEAMQEANALANSSPWPTVEVHEGSKRIARWVERKRV